VCGDKPNVRERDLAVSFQVPKEITIPSCYPFYLDLDCIFMWRLGGVEVAIHLEFIGAVMDDNAHTQASIYRRGGRTSDTWVDKTWGRPRRNLDNEVINSSLARPKSVYVIIFFFAYAITWTVQTRT